MHCVIVADVWKVTPLVALLLLAGLQTIPKELYGGSDGGRQAGSHTFFVYLSPCPPHLPCGSGA